MNYTVGSLIPTWGGDDVQTITFIVTGDCNLRCKYCYITEKEKRKMDFQIAKKFIDYLLSGKVHRSKNVVIEFIGGEPLLEIDLIDQIADYFKLQTYKLNDDWFYNYRFSLCSNGLLYADERVQHFINKNRNKMSFSISIDGNKYKHDMNRVKADGTGSYDDIMKILPLWKEQFPLSTKATFSSGDIKYLKESIIDLWNNDIYDVAANVVFEDVWKEGDDTELEYQLKSLADYVIDNNLWADGRICTFFFDNLGGYYSESNLCSAHCGAGKMLAVDYRGLIYPCIRFEQKSLNLHNSVAIGNVWDGIDREKVRPFILVDNKHISDHECLDCPIANGCGYCQGNNYDNSKEGTIFNRAKFICKMHKARVRANEYFFSRLYNEKNIDRTNVSAEWPKMYFVLSDDPVEFCNYAYNHIQQEIMDKNIIIKGLEYCSKNFYHPVFIHPKSGLYNLDNLDLNKYYIQHIVGDYDVPEIKNTIQVINLNDFGKPYHNGDTVIINVDAADINNLHKKIKAVYHNYRRINLNLQNINALFPFKAYERELTKIGEFIKIENKNRLSPLELDVLSDTQLLTSRDTCHAGDREFALAVDGRFYLCPYSYMNGDKPIGDLNRDICKVKTCLIVNQSLCTMCGCKKCRNCKLINKQNTNEFNVSPSFQCLKSISELKVSNYLFDKKALNYGDPIQNVIKIRNGMNYHFDY